jgi:hypothetical protein
MNTCLKHSMLGRDRPLVLLGCGAILCRSRGAEMHDAYFKNNTISLVIMGLYVSLFLN